ncbi:MAG: methylenetetrahydrofolate--tRNA-(uracil(54)-C(5))-methyltransferase (FADH(2)-oxidizing) TrmFO [Proteobacteria bacterium]|nr:methylenetetrahydrofolate--tRNA-(uracil(54)-C(5))-methyltransferase (FADH(2)-oxidizing) TrmFO [Pseudomonadota bacterium]MBU1739126.1 methylenetetrahydrofolate--tRNA-(uracil(54)-C(5))-methyltransferase (FADH(2)-oxidizing) TrmFO [Pseudomonadota bacterium]
MISIIGGGLAGCEAAWQCAERGRRVTLYEMKPDHYSPAHSSPALAELVCSNSLRSDDQASAVGLLKEEMRRMNSLLMKIADETKVPAGKALAVDRERFAARITEILEGHPNITILRREIPALPEPGEAPWILATGPLTSESLAESLRTFTGREHLAFYDAIAPIVTAESLDLNIIYQASRYDDGPGDYLNCPMNEEEYLAFAEKLNAGDKVPLRSFEDVKYFEGCLPIEVMFERGIDTPRFGPMKPVGLPDPRTGEDPYAVVQLRKENRENTAWNMVGFQTKLTYSAQREVFRMIPGMENAEFARLGSIHRNTFVCGPQVLLPTLQTRQRSDLFLAGQITGVEGYVESTAMGLLAGLNAARIATDRPPVVPPIDTAMGALIAHVSQGDPATFQPSNINFGLFPPFTRKMPKRLRGQIRAEQALETLEQWCKENDI